MTDRECVALLQELLPRLGLRWRGFSNLRGQVCKRINRRMKELGGLDVAAYRALLERDADERRRFDSFCRVTITRFYRDRAVFDVLREVVLPAAAERARKARRPVRCWSAGCASGEEPYTLAIVSALDPRFRGVSFEIIATEADAALLERARRAYYPTATVRDLPAEWKEVAFERTGEELRLRARFTEPVRFAQADLRSESPEGAFDLILCRNLAFTYFEADLQRATLARFEGVLSPGGTLAIGGHEDLPADTRWLPIPESRAIFRLEPGGGDR